MSTVLVTTRHLFTIPGFNRRNGFCRGKSRDWFRAQGLDWSAFVKNGVSSDVLEATGDGLALAVVAWARECEMKEQGIHGQPE